MAQTKKKRRRKHSGTQAGTIQRQAQGVAQTKQERRAEARQRRLERLDRPPTLRGSMGRAAIAAAIFVAVVIVAFGQPVVQGLVLGVFMFGLYVPIGYYTDLFIYRRRQRKKGQSREDERGSPRQRARR